MALDPRRFTVKDCPKNVNASVSSDMKKKSFFENLSDGAAALGKIGDIEGLNGPVGNGLRTLAKTSNSIRTGDTSSAIIPNSEGYVFEAVDIQPNAIPLVSEFNPGVVNRATAQAKSILVDVKAGRYKVEDIPNTFSELQNLRQLTTGVFMDLPGVASSSALKKCGASPYAIDLIKYAPKSKFLFVIQIELATPYKTSAMGETVRYLAFVIKNSTRPNINIEHEEVNMYNFWTRIPKRTVYEPITMRFYDDNKGLAHTFYTSYLQSISPISRFPVGFDSVEWLQANSMNQNKVGLAGAASLTALEGNTTSIISDIRLFHVYDYGKLMSLYHFQNPKLLTMNLDDLDMSESGSGSEIEIQFAYDALYINTAVSIKEESDRLSSASGASIGALYPIVPSFAPDDPVETPIGVETDGTPLTAEAINEKFAERREQTRINRYGTGGV